MRRQIAFIIALLGVFALTLFFSLRCEAAPQSVSYEFTYVRHGREKSKWSIGKGVFTFNPKVREELSVTGVIRDSSECVSSLQAGEGVETAVYRSPGLLRLFLLRLGFGLSLVCLWLFAVFFSLFVFFKVYRFLTEEDSFWSEKG